MFISHTLQKRTITTSPWKVDWNNDKEQSVKGFYTVKNNFWVKSKLQESEIKCLKCVLL